MPARCAFCGLTLERAQGYFVGAIYVNYGVTVLIATVGYFVLWTTTRMPTAAQLAPWVALEYVLNPEHGRRDPPPTRGHGGPRLDGHAGLGRRRAGLRGGLGDRRRDADRRGEVHGRPPQARAAVREQEPRCV